jgi:hypothetical protein
MIRDFTLRETRICDALADEFRAASWIVAGTMRRCIPAGVERAIEAIEGIPVDVRACRTLTPEQAWYAAQQAHLAALRTIIERE